LQIIPPLEGLEDKILLFKTGAVKIPAPTGTSAEREALAQGIKAQLPAFLQRLSTHKIPDELKHPRFGVKGYQHPEIARMVWSFSREDELFGLASECKAQSLRANGDSPGWDTSDLTAGQIYSAIYACDCLRDSLRKCCGSPRVAGRLLTTLAERNDGMVTSRVLQGRILYTLKA
jgi:hypothetical protein